MDALEKAKLVLLAHSKNMLNSALSHDWEAFEVLDKQWQPKLEAAVEQFGDQLTPISEQLMQDNQKILSCIKQAQQHLAAELQKNTQATSALKKYLK
ncbi:hypothetical protein QCB44_02795 [Thiomicrorhabdus sp. zzn3]|uniref:hypothetical protein n=1 Tax=Thiomicrorhabdus sp. zzn3 TaxID=3039775 RepID=UPI0024371AB9|nr:hypothetical protein [Thiomicrorhabdus sp. zzn3]MDG6777627.1 hypothetical protein [Thiomicrorhabdus sp. zzn3]